MNENRTELTPNAILRRELSVKAALRRSVLGAENSVYGHLWTPRGTQEESSVGTAARSRVLTSVRPLARPFMCRGPVWEFADRIQNSHARLMALIHKLAFRSGLSSTVAPYLPSTAPTFSTTSCRGRYAATTGAL
jgi:hypothetical protein